MAQAFVTALGISGTELWAEILPWAVVIGAMVVFAFSRNTAKKTVKGASRGKPNF